jgi:NADPH:quinone reductase-like Zn-dependent oxidoreductase
MRALNIPAAGQRPEVSDLPVPAPTEGTVLIKVMAASLNAIDVALAGGMAAGTMARPDLRT